jgi:hypothetical protein
LVVTGGEEETRAGWSHSLSKSQAVVNVSRSKRDLMKIEGKNIVKQISAFKASVMKKLDELEKSALLEMQTTSQDSIYQMEREESELEKSVSLIEKHLQQLDFLTKNGSNQHVFLLLHRLLPPLLCKAITILPDFLWQAISHAVPPNLHSLTYLPSLLYIRRNDVSASIRLSSLSTTIPDTY